MEWCAVRSGNPREPEWFAADDRHAAGAGPDGQSGDDIAEGPVPGRQDVAPLDVAGAADRLQADRDGFEQRTDVARGLGGDGSHAVRTLDEVVRKRAVAVVTQVPHPGTEMGESPRAFEAFPARDHRMRGDPGARLEPLHLVAALHDRPGGLVAEHARQGDAERVGRQVDQVRRADRRRRRPDQHIARTRPGRRQRRERKLVASARLERPHRGWSFRVIGLHCGKDSVIRAGSASRG
jgi:hypothetical protein